MELKKTSKYLSLYCALAAGTRRIARLVSVSGLPRRQVEAEVRSLGIRKGDRGQLLFPEGLAIRLRESVDQLEKEKANTEDSVRREVPQYLELFRRDLGEPRKDLDHVPATVGTVIDRVKYLCQFFDLENSRILFLGDHDGTSVGLSSVLPHLTVTVIDIDEHLLGSLAQAYDRSGAGYTLAHSDLRFPLDSSFRDQYDLIFTDPPYSVPGMKLFMDRSYEALSLDSDLSRVLVAFGFSPIRPDTGWKVQREILSSGFVIESLVSDFNRYDGAEALGSRAALYSLIPISKKQIGKQKRSLSGKDSASIYSHGRLAVETGPVSRITNNTLATFSEFLRYKPKMICGFVPSRSGVIEMVSLSKLLSPSGSAIGGDEVSFIVDCRQIFPDSLPHIIIAAKILQTGEIGLVLPLADSGGWKQSLVQWLHQFGVTGVDWKFVTENESNRGGAVCAYVRWDSSFGQRSLLRYVLDRPHGRLINVLREATITVSDESISKKDSAEKISPLVADLRATQGPIWTLPAGQWKTLLKAIAKLEQ